MPPTTRHPWGHDRSLYVIRQPSVSSCVRPYHHAPTQNDVHVSRAPSEKTHHVSQRRTQNHKPEDAHLKRQQEKGPGNPSHGRKEGYDKSNHKRNKRKDLNTGNGKVHGTPLMQRESVLSDTPRLFKTRKAPVVPGIVDRRLDPQKALGKMHQTFGRNKADGKRQKGRYDPTDNHFPDKIEPNCFHSLQCPDANHSADNTKCR